MKLITIISAFFLISFSAFSQNSTLEKVFLLGGEEQKYEQLTSTYSQSLLEAASGDIQTALGQWLEMQLAMDRYAEQINFNLNGIKVYMHIFFAANGQIDQLGFLLRPDSRHVEVEELRAFFAQFIAQYQFPLQSARPYNHYTGAAFPTLYQRSSD